MDPMTIEPLKVSSSLASNPKSQLQFAATVELKSGEKISVADPKATRGLVALMDMQAVMGGAASHFGGPAAFAEITSAMYGLAFHQAIEKKLPWHQMYHLINDAGHCENGIYALKANYGFADLTIESLKGFRSIKSPLTGHGESHIWPEGVYLSNGPLGSSLPQAQGLAAADALRGNLDRVTVTAISDGACMEGEAKEALAAIPGLAAHGKMSPFVLVISDNNTKLSGRIDEQSFSMNPSFASLAELGWDVLFEPDGQNLQKCMTAFESAVELAKSNPKKPVAIHLKTIKGFGTKKTAESASGAHGFPLKSPNDLNEFVSEIFGDDKLPQVMSDWIQEMVAQAADKSSDSSASSVVPTEKVQVGVAKALIEKRKAGLPILSISSDLPGSTGTAGFQKAYPECTIDVGIAESNMVSMASGLSKEGFIPVVDTFAQFGVTKGALPLTMASLSGGPVIAIFSHIGFQDAADGASHQALGYISMLASIPNVELHILSTSKDAEQLVGQAIDHFVEKRTKCETPKSHIFFLGRENFPHSIVKPEMNYQLGKAAVVFDSSLQFSQSVTLVAAGPLVHQCLRTAEQLSKKGQGAVVVQATSVNSPDLNLVEEALSKTDGRLVTVDDHQVIGGLGSLLVHGLVQKGVAMKLKSLGVDGKFGQSAYTANELYQKHGMDQSAILKAAECLLN